MRLNLPAVLTLALLGACATPNAGPAPPNGLLYSCRTPGSADISEALITFNGQGYQPGNVVRSEAGERPRSTAMLTFAGREYEMMADWAYLGMRYRSMEPVEAGRALVWTADGEEARILSAPATGEGGEAEIANCTRKRSVDGAEADTGHGDTHHR